jgi:hypothetical protein
MLAAFRTETEFSASRGFASKVLQPAKQGASIKPGAAAPGDAIEICEPLITGDSPLVLSAFARLCGLFDRTVVPGAHAPGFALTPASQVKKRSSDEARLQFQTFEAKPLGILSWVAPIQLSGRSFTGGRGPSRSGRRPSAR